MQTIDNQPIEDDIACVDGNFDTVNDELGQDEQQDGRLDMLLEEALRDPRENLQDREFIDWVSGMLIDGNILHPVQLDQMWNYYEAYSMHIASARLSVKLVGLYLFGSDKRDVADLPRSLLEDLTLAAKAMGAARDVFTFHVRPGQVSFEVIVAGIYHLASVKCPTLAQVADLNRFRIKRGENNPLYNTSPHDDGN